MILGIGVDTVTISEVRRFIEEEKTNASFVKHTFIHAEIENGKVQINQAEYYAACFAAKEVVLKALAHLAPEKFFDLRIVETLNDEDGCP